MEAETDRQIVPNSLDSARDLSDLGPPISATCTSVPLRFPEPLGVVEEINADQNCNMKLSTSDMNCKNLSTGSSSDEMQQINSSIEGEMQILEADTCHPLGMSPSPVSFHLASDLHTSLAKSNVDQNCTFKHPRSNSSCINVSSGECGSSEATCPSAVFPHDSPMSVESLHKSNVAQNGSVDWPTSKSDCRNSRSFKKVKVSSEEGELQTVEPVSEPITKCQSSITPRRSPRFSIAVENRNEGQNSTVKKPTSKAKCGNSNLSSSSKKVKLSTGENDLEISGINQDDGDSACFFVGEPVPDEEARQRWPHHYVEQVLAFFTYHLLLYLFSRLVNIGISIFKSLSCFSW